jgi:signal transduction histidine kinase
MSSAQKESALILLVVDGDTQARSQLCGELELAEYRVVEAQDAKTCLMLFKQLQPDLVLLDADTPELDLLSCCESLRSSDRIPLLVLVNPESQPSLELAFAAGVVDIILKPSEANVLGQRIKRALQTSQLQRQIVEHHRSYQSMEAYVQKLERLNTLKDEFLSTLVHELRTPLTNMKVASQLVEIQLQQAQNESCDHPGAKNISKAEFYLQTLRSECERQTVLISNLLDLQHLDAGIYPLELESIDLQIWVPKIAEPFQQPTVNRQQTLKTQVADNLPPLFSSALSLERVLNELIHNACKYTPPGETILVAAKQAEPDLLQISVNNSGIEIPVEQQARIFEKFYRIPRTDRWKQGGSGLGLALVQKLVFHLGGTIQLQSSAGQTTFVVHLPVNGPQVEPADEAS